MGVSDPELRRKLFEHRWRKLEHESELQSWPRWKRFLHRLQKCPICKVPPKERHQSNPSSE